MWEVRTSKKNRCNKFAPYVEMSENEGTDERGGSFVIRKGTEETDSSPSPDLNRQDSVVIKDSPTALKRSGVTFAADVPRPTSPELRPQYDIDESKPLYFKVDFSDKSLDIPKEAKIVSV